MAKNREPPSQTLAKNLRKLMRDKGLSAPEVASRAKVDRKTVNNQLNARFDPRLTQVQAVAEVFGLTCWQLLSPDMNPEHARQDVQELLDIWYSIQEPERPEGKRYLQFLRDRPRPSDDTP